MSTTPEPPAATDRAPARHVVVGAGAVGAELTRQAVAAGHEVQLVSRTGSASVAGARAVAADVTDTDALTAIARGATAIHLCVNAPYHRWAELFPPLQRSAIAVAADTGARLVVVENLYGYGAGAPMPLKETTPVAPTTVKGRVRAEMSDELFAAHHDGRVSAVSVRGADYYGPGVIESAGGARFFEPILKGGTVRVLGDPDLPHAYTYVPDVAATMLALADRPDLAGRPWHVPTAPAPTQRSFAELAATAAGTTSSVATVPTWMLRLLGRVRPSVGAVTEMLYQFAAPFTVDSSDAEHALGLVPTPLDEGVAATVDWYRSRR